MFSQRSFTTFVKQTYASMFIQIFKSDSKDLNNVTKDFFQINAVFKLSIRRKNPEKNALQFPQKSAQKLIFNCFQQFHKQYKI